MTWIFNYFRYLLYDLRLAYHDRRSYYRDPDFSSIDRALLSKYIFRSPYRVSKRYLKQQEEKDLYTYGETPLKTFEEIAKQLDIRPIDQVLELGSGRGRGAFFLAHFYNCRIIGIERIPQFVKLARHVATKYEIKKVSFECIDMFEMKWPKVNVIYLYGVCLNDHEIQRLIKQFKKLPKGTRILSVSYSLNEYDDRKSFKVEKEFPVSFPWGETEAYVNVL